MSSQLQTAEFSTPGPAAPLTAGCASWYAVQTRARHEKRIGTELQEKGFTAFVPTLRTAHRWSDRTKIVELPIFSCYVFVKLVATPEQRLEVLKTMGVFRFVSVQGQAAPIPEAQIESIQRALQGKASVSPCDYLKIGQRVRIRGGCLDGVEGMLTGSRGERKLVISVDLLQQSVAVVAEDYTVESI
jgi:transcription antitermination factor NusG